MHTYWRTALALAVAAIATQAAAQVTFYEREGFEGRSFTTGRQVSNFQQYGFNDRASSVVVLSDRWEACVDSRYRGNCTVLRPGRYASLAAMGLNDRVSSVRIVAGNARFDDDRYAPDPLPVYDNRRRNNERLYQAHVTSVRAILGSAEQRCWVEREQVSENRRDTNVPGAIMGALIGGVLGHQVGGGRGRDLATAGGAAAGAVVGANIGRDRNGQQTYTQDVQRCTTSHRHTRPEYWDVTYDFRGVEHRVQMAYAPGSTVTVNRRGEPRN
ncbi:beta/gamma crystallin-related protein [Chitinimonas viridis]|uniref:Beta/gamma crystallin-related protein n=1 Tax=Chitinimonas viridis TaxID=664880 RepID=A0ABT8B0W2_9NEIS|nr:beta/gamma crystallin-related protein [Chitinimonas viridis]MDN3575487.1 beta/gamma crystallin-related protein [Chitinimonas viridis]